MVEILEDVGTLVVCFRSKTGFRFVGYYFSMEGVIIVFVADLEIDTKNLRVWDGIFS